MTERKKQRRFNAEDAKFVYRNYANMKNADMAERLGLSMTTITNIVKELKANVTLPKKTTYMGGILVHPKNNAVEEFVKELDAEKKAARKAPAIKLVKGGRRKKAANG